MSATLLLPQRALTYTRDLTGGEAVTVRAVPDLLAFLRDALPLIVDWKVHTHAAADFREQLAGYASTLICSNGQWGLLNMNGLNAKDVELIEAQLLTDELRHYRLADEDIGAVEAYRVESSMNMRAILICRQKSDRDPYTVPTTTDLKVCNGCNFKAPCQGGAYAAEVRNTPRFVLSRCDPTDEGSCASCHTN